MCGTEPFPKDFRARKYKLDKHSLSKADFMFLMGRLPVQVEEAELEEMFVTADTDQDGELEYAEFRRMVSPPLLQPGTKPHVSQLGLRPQGCSPLLTPAPPGAAPPHL